MTPREQRLALPFPLPEAEDFALDASEQRATNPVARLDQTLVVADTSEDGSLSLRVYNLEGELVSQRQGTFTPAQMAAGVEVLEPSQAQPNVVSGTYLVDVRWTGLSGNTFAEVLPAVVIQ